MVQVPEIALNDGNTIPQLGFGVWRLEDDKAPEVVGAALDAGYRHIDTAEGYSNEGGVGEAIKNSGLAREDVFVTSKLRNGAHERDQALAAFDKSLELLKLDYLDLFLIHWPVPQQDKYVEAWKTLIELKEQGRVKSIGVSNFLPEHLERIQRETGVTPAVNQIELHPYYQERGNRTLHAENQIAIESYSPLGSGAVLGDETIAEIGKAHGKSVAQVIIRWHLQQGLIVLPKTATVSRVPENFDVFDFELSPDDMSKIDALDKPDGKTLPTSDKMNNTF
ncbi:oxidoreductase [Devosia pacifica]|uniref:Oxidoreductase n=1 Tax=Devosia pacifica TaxID=1335967 RepID=A0A918S0U3_9HYPH|nr:aldo/keto reductase [Devosia pacifica]GHA16664.1 oxidoreductase [Devosia pacifica]